VTGLANLPIGMGPPGTGGFNIIDTGAGSTEAAFSLWMEDLAGVKFDFNIYWAFLFGLIKMGDVASASFDIPHDITAPQLQNMLNSAINVGNISFGVSGQGTQAAPFMVTVSGLAHEWWGITRDERIEIHNFVRINPDFDESIALSNFSIEGNEGRSAVYGSEVVTFIPYEGPGEPEDPEEPEEPEPEEPDPSIEGKEIILHIGPRSKQSITIGINSMTAASLDIKDLEIGSISAWEDSLKRIDKAIELVSGERARIGAVHNRLENIIDINQVTMENTLQAQTRIEDLDMAKGIVDLTRDNVRVTSGMKMLAHTNLRKDNIMFLLENRVAEHPVYGETFYPTEENTKPLDFWINTMT
ncbi:MAG: hypothetical protein GX887_05185, partial [Firmicutes bacterium]|nr:hypothetical protein [Bacillota bacterium]